MEFYNETNFREMFSVDLKLSLLSGDSINLDNITITPYKLKEIKKYGFSNYMFNLQFLSLTIDDFLKDISDENKKKLLIEKKDILTPFDFFVKFGGEDIFVQFMLSLSMIFRTDDIHLLDSNTIVLDFLKLGYLKKDNSGNLYLDKEVMPKDLNDSSLKVVTRENFKDIVNIIKLQNYLEKPFENNEEDDFNPADDEVRKLKEQMKKMREKVEEIKSSQKSDENDEIDISEIISAVSSKSNSINKMTIWDLTLFQLYDEYARLELIDNYNLSIKAMLAGAEKIDIRHWSSKIATKEI